MNNPQQFPYVLKYIVIFSQHNIAKYDVIEVLQLIEGPTIYKLHIFI